jgi:L-aminopeptidase/D-esterase-like protein
MKKLIVVLTDPRSAIMIVLVTDMLINDSDASRIARMRGD